MERENYAAERDWLSEFLDYDEDIEISTDAERTMIETRVTLCEVLEVLRFGTILWGDRDYEGCLITVRGRNCDGEELTVFGRFNSEMMRVSVDKVTKARKRK